MPHSRLLLFLCRLIVSARAAQVRGVQRGEGVLHFIFLAGDDLPLVDVWLQFFARAPQGSWRAWLHCVDYDGCQAALLRSAGAAAAFSQVPTVPSEYCQDLVSPMAHAARTALASSVASGSPLDKFVFVSDSTLPVKPFREVWRVLRQVDGSDLCVAPRREWLTTVQGGSPGLLVKASQWSVLSRDHAARLSERWGRAAWHVTTTGEHAGEVALNGVVSKCPLGGCVDEFGVFEALFGSPRPPAGDSGGSVDLPGFTRLFLAGPEAARAQGRCHTFNMFLKTKSLGNQTDHLMEVLRSDPGTDMRLNHDDGRYHPWTFAAFGAPSLKALRASPFLFARKAERGVAASPDLNELVS